MTRIVPIVDPYADPACAARLAQVRAAIAKGSSSLRVSSLTKRSEPVLSPAEQDKFDQLMRADKAMHGGV